ncbi:hypothetical protein K2173_017110 [Erythroxylum novogranatense]|uniref:UspA domain-containing protein n=1 Tax=Erythroxylum novogranatense TaxID=1862640 RepID=A0AAV8U924_9ROSI|nr:hypothetical protein K2173_017110 [Erythroxylum novogranatense]
MEKPKEKKNKVMVAIGDDDHSYKALMWTLDYVKELSSDYKLLIFASQPLPPNLTCNYTLAQGPFGVHHSVFSTPELMTSLLERNKKVALDLLEKAKKICLNYGVKAETITEVGEPKEIICNIVQKHNISLLVIGNNGGGSLKRVFQGSLSDYCMNNVKCPVLLVKGPN